MYPLTTSESGRAMLPTKPRLVMTGWTWVLFPELGAGLQRRKLLCLLRIHFADDDAGTKLMEVLADQCAPYQELSTPVPIDSALEGIARHAAPGEPWCRVFAVCRVHCVRRIFMHSSCVQCACVLVLIVKWCVTRNEGLWMQLDSTCPLSTATSRGSFRAIVIDARSPIWSWQVEPSPCLLCTHNLSDGIRRLKQAGERKCHLRQTFPYIPCCWRRFQVAVCPLLYWGCYVICVMWLIPVGQLLSYWSGEVIM